MRICHVSPHLPPDQGANALLPAQLGAWSRARGDSVWHVTHIAGPGGPTGPGGSGDYVRAIPRRRRGFSVARLLRLDAWQIARSVTRALDEIARDADILHLHSNGLIIEVAAAWARRRRLPYVLTLYGTEIWHYRRRWPIDPFTRAYRGAAHVTFYSHGLLDRAKALGLDRAGLSVVYPPVSDTFAPQDESTRQRWRADLGIRERYVVLNVKRLHPLAGQRFLIDAFARLTRERNDVRLVICGTGPLRSHLEELAHTRSISDRVTFTGLLPNDQIALYMAVADVFALPSLLEALPTVAVEALASGTPVVSADHPGGVELHEMFGGDVEIVPKEQVDGLAQALAHHLRDTRRTQPETETHIASHFRPAVVAAAYAAVYEGVLGHHP